MIMVTAYRGVKSHTGQPQSATCESTLAPGSTVAQQHLRLPLLRDKPAIQAPRCLGDPVKAKKQARNSSLSNRAREHSCQPQGMRRTPPVSLQVCTARARTASSQARSSNAQHRTDFKSKHAQGRLCLCCSRCFCFRRPRVGTLCPPSRCAAAQVTPLLAQHRCHRPQAPAPLTRTTRRSHYLQYISPHRTSDYSPLCLRSLRRSRFSQHPCCRYAAALAHS